MAITEQERGYYGTAGQQRYYYATLRAGRDEPRYAGMLTGDFYVTCCDCWQRLDCGTTPAMWLSFKTAVQHLQERGWHLCPGSRFRCPECQQKREQVRQTRKAARRA